MESVSSSPAAAAGPTLIPELAGYQHQFESIRQQARELTLGLAESQFNWRPGPDRWSMSECFLHLNMVGEALRGPIESAIAHAKVHGPFGPGPFRHGFFGNWLVRSMDAPAKHKFRASRRFTPVNGNPITSLLPTFLFYQDELILRLHQANGLDLARVRIHAPGPRFPRLSLGQAFAFLAAHERRHLWQARQVRDHPQFPPEGWHRGRPNPA
jgi:hypothetical protein